MTQRDYLLIAVIALVLGYLAGVTFAEPQSFVVTVQQQKVVDYRGIQHFDLIGGKDGRVSVLGDADVAFTQALMRYDGKKVRIVVQPFEPERIER